MSSNTTWRWTSLLVVLAMMLSMAAATVSASPAPARPEAPSAAPAQQPPPPEAKKAPEPVHPAQPQPPAVSPEEALRKIHPDLRELAQTASPALPDRVGTLAGPSVEPIIIEVVAEAGTDLSAYFVDGKVIARPPLGKGEKKTQIFIGFAYPYSLMKLAS
ncbi:MAG: hypothetical protein ACP5N6_15515, partial [Anaerolineae bacterium]